MAVISLLRILQLLFILGALCSSAQSKIVRVHRRRHTVTNIHTHTQRQDGIYPVSGIPGQGVNTTAPRLEIRELQRIPDLFNVYLLGLQRWQNTSQDDKFSYFQIAGKFQ